MMNRPSAPSIDEIAKHTRNGFIIALIIAVCSACLGLYELTFWSGDISYINEITDGIMFTGSLFAIWLNRRGRNTVGIGLMLGAIYISILFLNIVMEGISWISAVTIIVVSTGAATTALPAKWGKLATIYGFALAILFILIDMFWPNPRFLAGDHTEYDLAVVFFVIIYCVILMRQFTNYSLRAKLIIGFVFTGVLSAGIIVLATTFITRQMLTDAANQTLLTAAKQTAGSINNFIDTNLDNVNREAQLPVIVDYLNLPPDQRTKSPEETEALAVLKVLSQKNASSYLSSYVSSYALLDRQGQNILDTYSPNINKDESDSDYFQKPLQTGNPYISSIQFTDKVDKATIHFSSPVRNSAGLIIGVILLRYDVAVFQKILKQQEGPAKAYAILLDENQICVAHGANSSFRLKSVAPLDPTRLAQLQAQKRLPRRSMTELTMNFPNFAEALKRAENTSDYLFTGHIGGTDSPTDQEQVVIIPLHLPTQPSWQVAFAQQVEVLLKPVAAQTSYAVLLSIGIVISVIVFALGLGRYLTRPIVNLTEVARRVTSGDLAVQAVVESRDEVGLLAEAFNEMTKQLRVSIGSLEAQVRERTADLALSLAVGERAASIRDLDELLPTITNFIGEQFDFHTLVYFADDLGQNLILRAGTGAVGEELLAHRHSLQVGSGSIVGRAAAEGKSVMAPNTQTSDFYQPVPLLSETRSELAIPLIVEGRVIGVLDMQANEAYTFTDASLTVFETMATQLSIAINSAQQWALTQEAQQKAEEAIRRLTHQSWAKQLTGYREKLGFVYNLSVTTPLSKVDSETEDSEPKLAVPVVVQNEPIGQLAVEMPPSRTLSADEQNLLMAVAQQLAQKVENLRLFEQTQQRATREQLARQIADKVRGSRDIETAIKTAAEELSKALTASRVVIDLKASQVDKTDRQ